MAGKPNFGLDSPSGGGAGVLCSFASLAASEDAEEEVLEPRRPEKSRKSVTRKCFEGESASVPWP